MKPHVRPKWAVAAVGVLIAYCPILVVSPGCSQPSSSTPPIVQIGHAYPLIGHAFSPDGTRLFTADSQCLMVWDAITGAKLSERPWTNRSLTVYSEKRAATFRFLNDGQQVLVDADLWDVTSGQFLRSLQKEIDTPLCLTISPDSRQVVYGLPDAEVRVVDIGSGRQVDSFRPSAAEAKTESKGVDPNSRFQLIDLAFTKEGPQALVRRDFGQASLWDVQSGKLLSQQEVKLENGRLSPDGNYFVTRCWEDTGSSVEEATIWDTHTGQPIIGLQESRQNPDSIKFLPDGQHAVVGIDQKAAELWQLRTGQKVRDFPGHLRQINSIQIDEAGKTMETRSCDAAIVWDILSGKKLHEFRHPDSERFTVKEDYQSRMAERHSGLSGLFVVPDPQRKRLLASHGNQLVLLDALNGTTIRKYNLALSKRLKQGTTIRDIEFSPTGKSVLVRHEGGRGNYATLLRDTESGNVLAEVTKTPIPNDYLRLSPDGHYALSLPLGEPVRLWDTQSGRLLQMIGHAGENRGYGGPQTSFSANSKYVVTQGTNRGGGIFFWGTATGTPLYQNHRPDQPPNKQGLILARGERFYYRGLSAAHPDGRHWACSYSQCDIADPQRPGSEHVVLWDTDTATQLHDFTRPEHVPGDLQFSPDGTQLVIRWSQVHQGPPHNRTDQFEFRDVQSGALLHTIPHGRARTNRAATVHFLPNGPRAIINDAGRSLYLWDLDAKQRLATLTDTRPIKLPNNPPFLLPNLLISPDGHHVLADYDSRYAILWDLENAKQAHVIEGDRGHCDLSTHFAFSLDGRRLLVNHLRNDPSTPTLWDLDNGCTQVERAEFSHSHHIRTAPDESSYWNEVGPSQIILFDVHSGKQKISFQAPNPMFRFPYYSIRPDGKKAIGRSQPDQPLCLWDLDTAESMFVLQPPSDRGQESAKAVPRRNVARLATVDWPNNRAALIDYTYQGQDRSSCEEAVSLWDLETGKLISANLRHQDSSASVFAVLFVPDSGDLITASLDGTAIRWNSTTGKTVKTYRGIPWNAQSLALTEDHNRLVVHCDNDSFAQWDMKSGQPLQHCYLFNNASRWVTITPDGTAHGNLEYVRRNQTP